ncbi:hypothetical protein Tco_0256869 [Tanacetum coccineum]
MEVKKTSRFNFFRDAVDDSLPNWGGSSLRRFKDMKEDMKKQMARVARQWDEEERTRVMNESLRLQRRLTRNDPSVLKSPEKIKKEKLLLKRKMRSSQRTNIKEEEVPSMKNKQSKRQLEDVEKDVLKGFWI